jgi:A118 family predicted phage portal protein
MDSKWPPKPMEKVYIDLGRWSAWWAGDADELSRVYGGYSGSTDQSFAQQGVLRTIQRWFWSQPPKAGEQRAKLHVPVAAEVAQVSADLIFGQPPTVTVKDDVTQERLDELIGDRGQVQLYEAAEACAALGHVYLRVGWDKDVDPTGPLLSVVDADAALPVYKYGRLQEVTFVREWEEPGSVLRHLELHEPGFISHAAYLGDVNNLGRMVPLSAYPQTADIADQDMIADPDRPGSGIETGIDRLDVVGVANQRSTRWRHIPAARDLGVADISGCEGALDALDDCWSSWMRDVRHGRSRIHVPMSMMRNEGLGKGASFDLDREIYDGMNGLTNEGPLASQLVATQFKIRYEEHAATATALLDRIVSGAGYSLQTFGLDTLRAAGTATESWARQIRTQNTRNGKIRHWDRAVRDLAYIMLAVDQVQFGGSGNPDLPVTVQFADTVSDAQLTRAQTATLLRSADAASTRTLVELVHNDWDGEAIDAEVELIHAEQGIGAPVPGQQDGAPPQYDQGLPPAGVEPSGHTGLDLNANADS